MEKKEKSEKAVKTQLKKEKNMMPGIIMIGLLAAVIVYAVMLHAEKSALADYEKGTVYVASRDIPEGIKMGENNYMSYFEAKELDKNVIPGTAISSPEELMNLIPCTRIDAGTIITTGMFETVNEVTGKMAQPVIAGFKVDDLYQAINGTLRAGDRIHIYSINEDEAATLEWSDIYVEAVFDGAGSAISNEDTTTAAQRVNIYMDKADIERFYSGLETGSLRAVKVCD